LLALLAEVGWALDIAPLKSVAPGLATMKANTALAFLLLGGSLFIAQVAGSKPFLHRTHKALAAVVAAFGLATLGEYLFGWDLGIDNLLFDDVATPSGQFPGRPSFGTAFNFMLLGLALLLMHIRPARFAASLLAVSAALISLLALYGYALATPALYSVFFYSTMAVHTALLFFIISIGCLFLDRDGWLMKIVFSDELGGSLARWLLPFALFGPAVLAMAFEYGVEKNLYHSDFGRALLSVSIAVSSGMLILYFAYRTNMLDAIRRAKESLEKAHAELAFFADGLAKANARLELLSGTDPLTELSNRRVFNARLSEELARSNRYGLPLSVLFLDVDNFKSYNDTFGHPEGDEVLTIIAHLLVQSVREVDCVARLGGEEFGIVMPGTEMDNALILAERVRSTIEHGAWTKRVVTVSIGVASLSDTVHDAKSIVLEADAALYEAKHGGRNRVVGAVRHGRGDAVAERIDYRASGEILKKIE
jgi:diguanylate cyclase (GGDEF)-like protein